MVFSMTNPPSVTGYSGLTQRTQLVLEPTANPGEQLLMPLTAGASTMSLTTQPSSFVTTVGMHLHFYVIGNPTSGSIGIVGTNASGGAQTSITYHVPVAPQNNQGYTEFTTKETWATVTASNITLTTLTPCQIIVFGSYGAKFLVPITTDEEEKITHHAPQDKRGILFKNLRVTQLTKGVSLDKFDADLYPDSLWLPYMSIGNTPTITTKPSSAVSMLAATTVAATMTLTTSLSTVPPGMFLIFTVASNDGTAGTIVISGNDQYGNAQSETISSASYSYTNGNGAYYSKRYSSIANSGADKFATTGWKNTATIAVTAVYAWQYSWTYDGLTNLTPYSAGLEIYDGVFGYALPQTIFSSVDIMWDKSKEMTVSCKGEAQDYCIVGDNTSTTGGSNPFTVLGQPNFQPYVSWPASFYIDNDSGGLALTTQDGSLMTYKFSIMTGRKFYYSGDTLQRPSNVTWDAEPDYTVDATIVLPNYSNYVSYFKPNQSLILSAQFQGALLGSYSGSTYFEQIQVISPCVVDTWKNEKSKNPVEGTLKLMSRFDVGNLGYAYKLSWIAQTPPSYVNL
jgi:hypothetical protein